MGNIEDPAKQERIRRGPHQFMHDPAKGVFGVYVEKPYHYQEYPKMMDRTPAPRFEEFKGKQDAQAIFDQAKKDWDTQVQASIVHNKAEEQKWLEEHADEKVEAAGGFVGGTEVQPARRGRGKAKAA